MSKEIKTADDWSDRFDEICEGIAKTRSILESLGRIRQELSKEVIEALREVFPKLHDLEETSIHLNYYFCRKPLEKWLRGVALNREEFYLLAAQGYLIIPSQFGSGDAYKEYTTYYSYEDDERSG